MSNLNFLGTKTQVLLKFSHHLRMRLLLLIAALAMLPMLPALAEESFDYSRYGYETIRSRVHFGKNASIGTINQGVVSLTFSKGNYSGSGDDKAIFQWNGGNLVVSVKSGYRIRWIILRDTEGGNRKNLNRVGSVSGGYKYDFDENSITNSGIAGKGVEKLNDDENNITIEDYNAPASSVTITDNTDTGNQLKARDIIVGYVLEKPGFEKANYGIKPNESVNLNFTSDHDVVPTFSTDNDGVSLSNGSKSGVTATGVSLDTTTVTASWTANATYAKGSTSAKVYVLPDYLCFTAEKAGSTISFNKQGNGGYGNVQISFDQLTWRDFTRDTKLTLDSVGNKVYFRGNYRGAYNGYTLFVMTGKIAASGNIMTLTDGNNPTTSLKGKGYVFYNLFMSCSALTSAPALPATTLAESCYNGMFNRCTALRSAPTLPATTLADYCYTSMFDGCTSLTAAPALPATTLTSSCYFRMFSGCTALTSAPALPATTLAKECYYGMFDGCTSLTSAPALPATTLTSSCYYRMFYGCTSLTSAPALPVTKLAEGCYSNMFYGCTSLTSAPALPATKLASYCYYNMFDGCTKLNSIKVAFTDWNSATDATYGWVNNVSSTGTFICPAELAAEYGTSNIPEGWTVQELPYLCFTAEKTNSTISFNASGNGGTGNVQTSTDGFKWSDYTRGTTITLKDVGDKVYFKGDYRAVSSTNYSKFAMTGKIAASGNVMTLTDGDNPTTSLKDKDYAFLSMFEGCTALTSAPELPATTLANNCYDSMFDGCTALTSAPELPATTLADHCYYFMFSDCTALTSAPELPATTLTSSCYYGMFEGCTALTSAPALPATTLASNCYYSMFDGCTSLTSAPELPATTLANNCYNSMFNGCTALTSAPALPATTLADFCYDGMFSGCTKLNSIKVAFTDWNSATYATQYWVEYVSSTGTFICPAKLAKEFGRSHIPEGWTVQELPDYLCFTAEKANSTISFEDYGGSGNVQKSTDGFTWSDYTRGTAITLKDVGDKVYFKGNYRGTSYENYSIFTMTGKIAASGNIMTLTDGDNPTTSLKGKSFVFYDLFHYCTALTSAPELPATTLADHCYDDMFSYCTSLKSAPELPATTLASYCYYDMFQGCSALTSAPELPATTLADYCYYYMFNGCTALTSAPKLPATELANYCYLGMFEKCTALTSAPSLPATTLADNCYASMFWDCTALTSAPALPATTLADYCYERMFSGCTKLNYIKVAFTNWDAATDATRYWVEGVSSTGTFDCPVELKKQYGTSYIPRGWYRQLDGSGTSNDPYKITSADDLIGLSGHNELWDKYFIQTNDIDFGFSSDAKSYFMPIGTSEKPFTGHYDGQQHIISNLTVNHPELSSAGLFGYIGKGATVKNLMVQGIVQGKTYAGIIAGVNEGELTAIAAFGTVQHTAGENSYLGGMIGKNAGGIHSSYAVVDIIHDDDDTCGGLVGQNEDGTYDNCYYDKQICPLSENWGIAFTTVQLTADGFAQKTLGSGFEFMPSHYPMLDINDELEQFATLAIILHSDENVVDNIHQVTHDFNVTPMGYCYWHGDNDNISIDEKGAVKLIKNGAITLYADFGDNGNMIARKTIKLQIAAKPKIEKLTQTVFKHGDILTTPAITLYEEIDNAEGGWEISFTGDDDDYHALENNELLEEHNGCYLRFWAKNSIGTSYSNVICITVTSSYTLPRSYRFSTFSSNMATDFSGSGLTPYYVSDKNEARTSVTLKPFENGIVPAGQGAVLYNADIIDGTSENFTVKVTTAAGTTPAVNYLKPALTAIDFPSASSAKEADYKYMLGDEDKWWWINGGTLAAGKAYLDLSSKPSAAKSFIMSFDEETTAISSSSNEKLGMSNSADAYNLAGQRVSKDYKGIVIKNGKKFKN